jgi:hypothetical protein
MGAGRTSQQRPLHVPVAAAHERITENIRRPPTGPHLAGLEDVDQIVRPSHGYALVYDKPTGLFKAAIPPPMVTFNQTSVLTVSGSDEFTVPAACKLFLVRARLKTTGSTTTTAVLKKNASTTVATFSFTSGNHTPTSTPTVSTALVDGDYLWLDTTAAGTSAAGLVVSVWAMAV